MSYASPAERLALRANTESSGFVLEFVVRVRKGERESELVADDCDHAIGLASAWINHFGADYAEIFRVNADGTLASTIGPEYRA